MSDKPKIELIDCEGGDWQVLKVDNEIFTEGHSIPDFQWLELFEKLGFETEETTISDEDMENGKY